MSLSDKKKKSYIVEMNYQVISKEDIVDNISVCIDFFTEYNYEMCSGQGFDTLYGIAQKYINSVKPGLLIDDVPEGIKRIYNVDAIPYK